MDNKKRFPISGSVWSIDICMQREWSACCCVSLRPSVSNWKWPSFSRLRKYKAHPFSSASFASLSSARYYGHCCGAKDHIFFRLFPLSFSCSHLLDERSPLPPLPFCSSVMCVWGCKNTGFKPQNFQNSGSVGGSIWAMLGPANRQNCSSVLLCLGCWNGRMVGLLHVVVTWMIDKCESSLLLSTFKKELFLCMNTF